MFRVAGRKIIFLKDDRFIVPSRRRESGGIADESFGYDDYESKGAHQRSYTPDKALQQS